MRLGGGYGRWGVTRAEVMCAAMAVAWIGMFFQVEGLRTSQQSDHRLIAELIQHEADQVDLLCDKGVYVGKETCDE